MNDLTAMTFNIRTDRGLDGRNSWFLRRRAVVATIREVGPDVAGLQEVRRLQLAYLRAQLPEYGFLSAGRANGRRRGEHCPVLYRRDRFTVERWEVRWFAEKQSGRIVTLARLRDAATVVNVANTHFDHRSEVRRAESGVVLSTWLQAEDGPWIVLGDFNATAADAGVTALLDGGLHDALAHLPVLGPGVATSHRFTGGHDGARIDQILVSPAFEVRTAEIVHSGPGSRLPSDHWPVAAVLGLRD